MSGFSKKLTIGLAAAALVLVSMSGAQARPVDDTALSALAGAEWLHSNGSWDGTRYSTLTQLNPCNAMNLKVKWIAGLGGTTNVQATPLMHDGIIFIPQDNKVMAYDARTGDAVWKYETEGYANLKFFSKTMGTQRRLPNGNTFIVEDNTGRLFQVKPDGEIVWEYVNRGGTTRPFPVPYDFTPQLRALAQPEELAVTPPNNLEWHLEPDVLRNRN